MDGWAGIGFFTSLTFRMPVLWREKMYARCGRA
jgi:hypothetical protein